MSDQEKTIYVPAVTRLAVKEDSNFIFHSWLKSYRASWAKGSNPMRYVDKEIYYANQKEIINYILQTSYVICAHNPDDINQLFGYIVAEPSDYGPAIIHYVFVKQPFRNLGIGTMLYREAKSYTNHTSGAPVIATHATGPFHESLCKKYRAVYDPFLIFRGLLNENESITHRANYKAG